MSIRKILETSLFRSAGVYVFSRILNAAIPFLIIPILTRYLTPSDYGIVTMFSLLVGIATPFVGLSLHGAISVKYFDEHAKNLSEYIGNCFYILMVSSVFVLTVSYAFSSQIDKYFSFPSAWIWSVVFVACTQFICLVLLTMWQVEDRPLAYGVFQNTQTLVNMGLSVIFVVSLGRSWQGRIEAQIITLAVFAAAAIYVLNKNRWISLKYNKSSIRNALNFGVPLIPHALGGLLATQIDRIFLVNMVDVAVVGIYAVGYQFGSVLDLVASSFNQAYAPWLYRELSKNSAELKKNIVKYTYICFGLLIVLAGFISWILPPFIGFFVGKEFVGAQEYVPWIAIGYAFKGMYYLVANYIFFANRTMLLSWVTCVTVLISIPLNYFFITVNGPIGVAQASALTFLIGFSMTWALSARVYEMPWRLNKCQL